MTNKNQISNMENELNEWLDKNNINSKYKLKENILHISLNGFDFEIKCPKNNKEFYIVDSKNNSFDWLDMINIRIISKKLSLISLLDLLNTKSLNAVPVNKKEETTFGKESNVNIDNYDIEFYKKRKYLESCISSSKSLMSSDKNNINRMFDNRTVANIIIEEFMNTWKEFKNSDKIKLDIRDNNIYNWNVKISGFTKKELEEDLSKLKETYGYNYIELDMYFHDKLYPNYPPIIKILRPKLDNMLMHKLANTKMVNLDYWTPARDTIFIINKIYKLLEKHAIINIKTEMNNKEKYMEGAFIKLEDYLIKLASLTDIKQDDLDDQKYECIKDLINKNRIEAKKEENKYWAKGTGYGHDGCKVWNIDAYLKSQQEKDEQITSLLRNIIIELENSNENVEILYNIIEYSYLIPYLTSVLHSVTLLEITQHLELYKMIFLTLGSLSNEKAIHLFCCKPKSLYSCIEDLNNVCNNALILDKNNVDEIIPIIMNLYSMLKPCYESYKEKIDIIENEKIKEQQLKNTEIEKYQEDLKNFKFNFSDIVNTMGQKYYYLENFKKEEHLKVNYQRRLIKEVTTLQQTLPIDYNASIFLRIDSKNMSVMRVLMTGPEGTPYDSGCFIFDMYINSTFPMTSPSVWFITHNGKRFNPNLYDNGKLCLSLLGTWNGDKGGESWNQKTSTLQQVLISIQSQILAPQPYFNEPGYERTINTPEGKKKSEDYNNKIRMYTMCHAMRDILKNINLYPEYEEVIKKHFTLKKKYILELCTKWANESNDQMTYKQNDYLKVIKEIEELIK